ncbi:hypothetical protein RA21_13835 [Leisingera sp. ANG-DT]|nr:hypothetical protein RA21_13835 [Leisingera sp. ANG-DT]
MDTARLLPNSACFSLCNNQADRESLWKRHIGPCPPLFTQAAASQRTRRFSGASSGSRPAPNVAIATGSTHDASRFTAGAGFQTLPMVTNSGAQRRCSPRWRKVKTCIPKHV